MLAEAGVITKQMEPKKDKIKREKLDPSDITGLLDHASPEASGDPPLDFTVTEACLSQESIGIQNLGLGRL